MVPWHFWVGHLSESISEYKKQTHFVKKKCKKRKFGDVWAKPKRHQTRFLGRLFNKMKRGIQRAEPFWLIPSGKASK
jgi:hypothetical protein